MRVGFELVSPGPSTVQVGGVGVYYPRMLELLSSHPDIMELVVFTPVWSQGMVPPGGRGRAVVLNNVPRSRGLRVAYEQTALPLRARREDIDILVSSCNTRPLLWKAPSVVVLHSLQYLFFPGTFGRARRAYLRRVVPASLRRADLVLTVSEWQRREAIRLFDLDPDRIKTVYPGGGDLVGQAPQAATRNQEEGAARPYVAMAANFYGYKNHRRLVEAFARVVRTHGVPHDLVFAGRDADVCAADIVRLAHDLGLGDRVRLLGPLSHDLTLALLKGADAVAYVSLFETFGSPIVEALALGRPLVVSNTGAMIEVAGDAARPVDPEDVNAIANGLADVLLDEPLRRRLREAGPAWAAQFTWDRCASETVTALKSAVALHYRPGAIAPVAS